MIGSTGCGLSGRRWSHAGKPAVEHQLPAQPTVSLSISEHGSSPSEHPLAPCSKVATHRSSTHATQAVAERGDSTPVMASTTSTPMDPSRVLMLRSSWGKEPRLRQRTLRLPPLDIGWGECREQRDVSVSMQNGDRLVYEGESMHSGQRSQCRLAASARAPATGPVLPKSRSSTQRPQHDSRTLDTPFSRESSAITLSVVPSLQKARGTNDRVTTLRAACRPRATFACSPGDSCRDYEPVCLLVVLCGGRLVDCGSAAESFSNGAIR